jgi:hypothetical protein
MVVGPGAPVGGDRLQGLAARRPQGLGEIGVGCDTEVFVPIVSAACVLYKAARRNPRE